MAFATLKIPQRARRAFVLASALSLGALIPIAANAHGEQIKIGANAKGPVHLDKAQEQALGLTLAAATRRPVSELLYLSGEVRPVAGREAQASSRIPGQVTQLYASLGQSVRAGQRLARVQSRLVGDPPPSVDILAPISGIIEEVSVSTGQAIEPATPLFRLRDSTQVEVMARVYEEDLGKIQVGQATSLRLISYPDQTFSGRIRLIGPSLDPLTRTVEVRVKLDGETTLLKPNLFARVGVVLRQNAAALTVPNAAVIEANGEKFVLMRKQDAYVRVDIEAGTRDANYTEVSSGLVPGDRVVVQGNRQVYTLWLTGGAPLPGEDD